MFFSAKKRLPPRLLATAAELKSLFALCVRGGGGGCAETERGWRRDVSLVLGVQLFFCFFFYPLFSKECFIFGIFYYLSFVF